MREFSTGATRDNDDGKLDFEGFLNPLVIEAFGEYMHKHRLQADGKLRDSDNWQKGIPSDAYIKSAWRHFRNLCRLHRGYEAVPATETLKDSLCALIFNANGYLLNVLRAERELAELEVLTSPSSGVKTSPMSETVSTELLRPADEPISAFAQLARTMGLGKR